MSQKRGGSDELAVRNANEHVTDYNTAGGPSRKGDQGSECNDSKRGDMLK